MKSLFLFRFVCFSCLVLVFALTGLSCDLNEQADEAPEEVDAEAVEEPEQPPEPPPPPLTRELFDNIHYGLGYWTVYGLLGEQEEHHRETVLVNDLPEGVRPYAIVWRTWRLEDEPDLAYRLGFIQDSLQEKAVVEWEDRFEVPIPADRVRMEQEEDLF